MAVAPGIYPCSFETSSLDPHAVRVVERLYSQGHLAYLVGGCVRDLLLGCAPKDFDVATDASPERVRKIFRNSRLIGRRFRLAHVVFGPEKVIEVATFRRRAESEDRSEETLNEADLLIRHDNEYGDPHEDALRRDFTINGLFYDVKAQEVIDYVGGYKDIEERTLRTIGTADIRFREDPVRMLRAIKFGARLGVAIAPEVSQALAAVRQELLRAAKPRLLEEVLRLFRSGGAAKAVELMHHTGLLDVVLPEVMPYATDRARYRAFWARLNAMDRLIQEEGAVDDAVLLAVLFYDAITHAFAHSTDRVTAFETFIESSAQRFALPRRLKERLLAVCIAQRRIERGRAQSLSHRSYYRAAMDFHEIQQLAGLTLVPDRALGIR